MQSFWPVFERPTQAFYKQNLTADYLLMAMRVGAMTDLVPICVNCSAVTGKLAQALETLALEAEKRRRMLDAILMPGEHLESP